MYFLKSLLLINSSVKVINSRAFSLVKDKAFVNGKWIVGSQNQKFEVDNPATGQVVGSVPNLSVSDVEEAINYSAAAFQKWKTTTPKERSDLLRSWYNLLVKNTEGLAKIVTEESGKPYIEAVGEVKYGSSFIEWFSEESRRIHGEVIDGQAKSKQLVFLKQPIGVVGLITPWNFPIAMITRKAGAALAAGCTCIVKPAEDTPLTALALAELADQAGFPPGVINIVTCDRNNAASVGKLLCTHDSVAGISFTGSTDVGKILYSQCAHGVKRLSLELGGNAPFIVFKSANIDKAVEGAIASKFRNCGQTCVSSNRFLVEESVVEEFIGKLSSKMGTLICGNGSADNVTIGPLINKSQIVKVSSLVEEAVKKGAKVIKGGKRLQNLGELFYEPTILTNVKPNMTCYQQEIFGPVVQIIPFQTEEEAVKVANNTKSGLAGYFYSENINQIWRVAKALEVGMVGINEGIISCPEAAFGGIKESGIGREGSHHGIDDFVYLKYLCFGGLH